MNHDLIFHEIVFLMIFHDVSSNLIFFTDIVYFFPKWSQIGVNWLKIGHISVIFQATSLSVQTNANNKHITHNQIIFIYLKK